MRQFILFILVVTASSNFFAQQEFSKFYDSDFLEVPREVQIHLPVGYDIDSINYPLAIVLDSEKLYRLYSGNATLFSENDHAPRQIVVGINMNGTKAKDTGYDPVSSRLNGDANLFYNFLRDEIIPYIEANYRTSPFLTIVGEGLSANFITHFLKEEEPYFNSFVCINPSLAPDITTQMINYNLERLGRMDNTFYFYVSNNPNNTKEKHDKISQFGSFLQSLEIDNFNVLYEPLSNSPSLSSGAGESIPRAFAKIFEIYSSISGEEFESKVKDLSPPEAITYLETKYLDIEFLFGTSIGIRKKDIVAIESIIMDKEDGDYLKAFGKMIMKLYPKSEMSHYYIGLYYETGEDYEKALEEYRIGYGKMDPSDPKADLFYKNVERVLEKMN